MRRALLEHPDDLRGAVLFLEALSGDPCWLDDLLRMYARWAERRRLDAHLVHQVEGEHGTKRAILELPSRMAYGLLAAEAGIHELRWASHDEPAADSKRRSGRVEVTVLPEVGEEEAPIPPGDLITHHLLVGRSCHGRHCNVWLEHRPSGIRLPCEDGAEGHRRALAVIRARVFAGALPWAPRREAPLARIYTLGKAPLIEDPRTGARVSDAHAALGGDLEAFVDAWLTRRG